MFYYLQCSRAFAPQLNGGQRNRLAVPYKQEGSYKTPKYLRDRVARYQAANPHMVLYNAARQRAKHFEREFAITPADVERLRSEAGTRCAGCGHEMIAPGPHAPSLDRVDNARGYTCDNVAVICKSCNSAKSDKSAGELVQLGRFLLARRDALAGTEAAC